MTYNVNMTSNSMIAPFLSFELYSLTWMRTPFSSHTSGDTTLVPAPGSFEGKPRIHSESTSMVNLWSLWTKSLSRRDKTNWFWAHRVNQGRRFALVVGREEEKISVHINLWSILLTKVQVDLGFCRCCGRTRERLSQLLFIQPHNIPAGSHEMG